MTTSTLQLAGHAIPARSADRLGRLPDGGAQEQGAERRTVLWTNGVCALVLGIGLLGIKAPATFELSAVAGREPAVVAIEFQALEQRRNPDPVRGEPAGPESVEMTRVPALEVIPPVAVVTLPELVPFALPETGSGLPALHPEAAVPSTPRPEAATATASSTSTASSGAPPVVSAPGPRSFSPGDGKAEGIVAPKPDYPQEAQRRMVSGAVKLEIEVTEAGTIGEVRKLVSSGAAVLDNHTVAWVRRRWKFPAGRRQLLHTEFVYELAAGR